MTTRKTRLAGAVFVVLNIAILALLGCAPRGRAADSTALASSPQAPSPTAAKAEKDASTSPAPAVGPGVESGRLASTGVPRFDIEGLLASATAATDEAGVAAFEVEIAKAAPGALEELTARLESRASQAGSPPGIHLALAFAYGRKGLLAKQYSAIGEAERAAKPPGLVFSLAAIYGRKELLASDPRAFLCRLSIASEPVGAAVTLDGKAAGEAPLELVVSTLDEHRVGLVLPGYEGYEKALRLAPGAREVISVKLAPKPARLLMKTDPPGATLVLDGDDGSQKTSPAVWETLAPGRHKIEVRPFESGPGAQYKAFSLDVELGPDEKAERSVALIRGTARVFLRPAAAYSLPEGARFIVDGNPVGSYPYADAFEIPSGAHAISARSPGYIENARRVSLDIGSTSTFSFDELALWAIPRSSIKIDGKAEDWAGIAPLFSDPSGDGRMGAYPGTDIIKGYLCADDKNVYWRVDFANGVPKSIPSSILEMTFVLTKRSGNSDMAELRVQWDSAGANPSAKVNIVTYSPGKKVDTTKTGCSFKSGDGFIEAGFPFAAIRDHIKTSTGIQSNLRIWSSKIEFADSSDATQNMTVAFP